MNSSLCLIPTCSQFSVYPPVNGSSLAVLQRGCQTRAVQSAEAQVQTVSTTISFTQTEPQDQETEQLLRDLPDPPGLKDFLQRVEKLVVTELVKNAKSHAFDGFQVNWGDHSQLVSRMAQ